MALMNNSNQSVGYLTVMVSTARGAIPLEGATVNIRGNRPDSSEILFSLLTDRDGKTPKVSLPTPPKENSEAPGREPAYATYNIDVFKDGYIPLYFNSVPVFPSVMSIQPAVLVPSVSTDSYTENMSVTESPESTLK